LWFVFVYQTGVVSKEYQIPVEYRYLPENITVVKSVPSTVKVIISGNNRDVETFEAKDLSVTIDAKEAKEGDMKIEIKTENVKVPKYLDVTSLAPKVINVSFKEGL
jgi:YbbR domain-containing protein